MIWSWSAIIHDHLPIMSDRGSYFFDPIDHDREWSWLTFLQVIVKWSAIIAFAKIPNNANHSFAENTQIHIILMDFYSENEKNPVNLSKWLEIVWFIEKWKIFFQKKLENFWRKKLSTIFFFLFAYICDRKMIADHSWMIVDHISW